jgi:hypothetical protein
MGIGDAIVGAVTSVFADEAAIERPVAEWELRLKEAAYISPGGTRIAFQYVDLSRVIERRTAIFQFAGLDGKYVQDNGHDDGTYPMLAFFSGDNHDQFATAFERALIERGRGRLEHPMYGTQDVVPTGSITRTNQMVQAANQTTVAVTFSATLANVYPDLLAIPSSQATRILDGWDASVAATFAERVDLDDPVDQSNMAQSVLNALDVSAKTVREISKELASAQLEYDERARAITESIDTLVNAPQNLGFQLIQLIKSPARTAISIESKISGFVDFCEALLSTDTEDENRVALKNLLVTAGTGAAADSANSTEFQSRPQALGAAEDLIALNASNNAGLDEVFTAFAYVDTGDGFKLNEEAVARISGRLVVDAFELLPERAVVLNTARNFIELCSELYGNVEDTTLQRFIDTNSIAGDEFYMLERGRRIVYYA